MCKYYYPSGDKIYMRNMKLRTIRLAKPISETWTRWSVDMFRFTLETARHLLSDRTHSTRVINNRISYAWEPGATGWTAVVQFPTGARNFLFCTESRTVLGPTQPHIPCEFALFHFLLFLFRFSCFIISEFSFFLFLELIVHGQIHN